MEASPKIGDVKVLNQLTRQLKSQPVKLQFWPLTGLLRILGFPGVSYRNNVAPAPQEKPFQVMFAETQHTEQQNELHTCEHKNQDATKITSAFADSRIQFCWSVMTFCGENVVSALDPHVLFLSVALPSSSFVTMISSSPEVSTEWRDGHRRRLKGNMRTNTMKLWHSPGTTSSWCLIRRV